MTTFAFSLVIQILDQRRPRQSDGFHAALKETVRLKKYIDVHSLLTRIYFCIFCTLWNRGTHGVPWYTHANTYSTAFLIMTHTTVCAVLLFTSLSDIS